METIWKETIQYENKQKMKDAYDVVVIGAGMCGLLCAWELKQRGLDVVVLEAKKIMSGQSGKTTAKITSQHNLIYDKLSTFLPQEQVQQYASANEKAIQDYQNMIEMMQINCDFKKCRSYLYTTKEAGIGALRKEYKAAKKAGIDAKLDIHTELPMTIKEALCFENQASFNPMKFVNGFVNELEIYEDKEVLKVEDHTVFFHEGEVQGKYIVFATHFPFINMPGYYFLRMHQERSYVIAAKKEWNISDLYYCIDEEILSLRGYQNNILFGGGKHRTGENSKGGRYQQLKQLGNISEDEIIVQWSAQDCMTLDTIPYIGYYTKNKDYWFVATGFNKWGMTHSMVAAQLIADLIEGIKNPSAEVFSPQRFHVSASAVNLWENGLQSVKGIAREHFKELHETIAQLPKGHGGIVEINEGKAGVYKDEQGEIHLVNVKCPHLGCQLEWNPDEKSWDCPCHGSRFTYDGELIDHPAQCSLAKTVTPVDQTMDYENTVLIK